MPIDAPKSHQSFYGGSSGWLLDVPEAEAAPLLAEPEAAGCVASAPGPVL